MRQFKLIAFLLGIVFLLSSCLTCEYKEYKFELSGKGKSKLTIKFVNIMSKYDSEEITKDEQITKDYEELTNTYIIGDEMEKKYPNAKLISKRLFEENNQLCGEAVYEFDDISQANIYQYDKKSPYMYYLGSLSSETFYKSNGKQGPDYFPAVVWDKSKKELTLTTKVNEQDEKCTSLLYKWKSKK